jgi:hypothetical protein
MTLKFTLTLSTLFVSAFISGCSKDSSTASSFGAPNIGAIVDAAVPTKLKTSPVAWNKTWNRLSTIPSAHAAQSTCTTKNPALTSSCYEVGDYVEFVRDEVFQKITGVAGTQYYRYWIDVLDTAMSETDGRITGSESAPACVEQTPVEVAFTFNINNETVTVRQKLQCWEQQTAPGSATQNMAFGKDSENVYLVYRTNDNAFTNGSGERYVIAKASVDGNQAEIWFVGASCQKAGGASCSGRSEFKVNAQRVLANKSTGSFTFNTVEDDTVASGMHFGDFYANSNGQYIFFEAAYGSGSAVQNVDDNDTSTNTVTPWCLNSTTLFTTSLSNCSTLNRSSMPSNFGLSAPMRNSGTIWQASSGAKSSFLTALDTISSIDYTAQGVGKFE